MGNRVCPICDGDRSEFLREINMKVPKEYHLPERYNVVSCVNCGLVYADTSATEEDYDWFYSNCNFYGDDSKDDNKYRYEITKDFLEEYVNLDSRMLNFGAGNGRFEVALKENGYFNIVGTDPSLESVNRLKNAGIKAYVRNIYSDVSYDEIEKYDCVFLFEVAEHLLHPQKGIQSVKKMLKKNGVFIISVPDYSQIEDDRSSIPNYFNLEHINYFSEQSLDNLMGKFGMKRVEQKRDGIDLIHVYINCDELFEITKDTLTKNSIQKYFQDKGSKEKEVEQIIERINIEQREIVIWGTGSYVMSLIAKTNLLKCNIKGFVDNNKIKQGREMYGYTIYAPDFLLDKNYIVLICSMLNSEEIRTQLESMHTKNEIVVL